MLSSQYLIKTGLNITKGDLKEIQQTDHNLSLKIAELNKQYISEIKDFQLHDQFKSYCDVKWWIANRQIYPTDEVPDITR